MTPTKGTDGLAHGKEPATSYLRALVRLLESIDFPEIRRTWAGSPTPEGEQEIGIEARCSDQRFWVGKRP
ncbi:MAG: hypothetical protein ACE5HB_09980 [Terriglobia bacterium]